MVVSLEYELVTFFSSIILALFTGILYDFFHALREVTKKTIIWDMIMWTVFFVLIAAAWFFSAGGQLRWYMILGTCFSWIIYFLTVSKYVFLVLRFFIDKIYAFFCIIFKILLTPLRFLCRILNVYIGKAKSKFSKKDEEKYDEKKA